MRHAIRSAAVALALALAACAPAATPLTGTDLGGGEAPDFTLTDGLSGASVSLSSLRGSVVVLTFLYTRCTDTCPLTAERLRGAQKALGADASSVELVAVSVDPENDTPQAVRAFSELHGLGEHWRYLIGGRAQLQAVWSKYGVGVLPSPAGAPAVDHNDAIYLIDRRGRERVLTHSDEPPTTLANDLRALVKER